MLKAAIGHRGLLLALSLVLATGAQARDRKENRPDSFVDAAAIVSGLIVEARYFGAHNFVGRRIDGYERPLCLLTRPAAAALAQVARDLEPRGLALKTFDCYRPVRAVRHFVQWARNLADVERKAEFYPDVDKRDLFRLGYISAQSGHSRGSTIDLTLARRDDGRELDMGTPFDFFSTRSWPTDRRVSSTAQANRALLAQAMKRRGFIAYSKEWWHFTLRAEPYPTTYFDFPVR